MFTALATLLWGVGGTLWAQEQVRSEVVLCIDSYNYYIHTVGAQQGIDDVAAI